MPNYRRSKIKGGTFFFTVVTYRRQKFLCNKNVRQALGIGIRKTKKIHPFVIESWVLLPDHLHCIWTLPKDDFNFGKRWGMIKRFVTKQCKPELYQEILMNKSKLHRNESTIWQRRFWEHTIRNEIDFEKHMDYIHYNPVKHGYVKTPIEWPYSTFHRYIKNKIYSKNWAGAKIKDTKDAFGE